MADETEALAAFVTSQSDNWRRVRAIMQSQGSGDDEIEAAVHLMMAANQDGIESLTADELQELTKLVLLVKAGPRVKLAESTDADALLHLPRFE